VLAFTKLLEVNNSSTTKAPYRRWGLVVGMEGDCMYTIIIIILLYIKFMNRTPVPKGVQLYFANIGAGKTTLLSKIVYQVSKPRYWFGIKKFYRKPVYDLILSNCLIDGTYYTSNFRFLCKQIAVAGTLIIIDEGSIEYNNRSFADKKNALTFEEIQYLKLIRHYQSCIVIVSQSYEDIDVTLRRLYTHIYLLEYLPFGLTLIKQIKKHINIDKETGQIIEKYHFVNPFAYRLLWRPKYFKYFDSWWIPEGFPVLNFKDEAMLRKFNIVKMKDIDFTKFKKFKGLIKEKDLMVYFKSKKQVPVPVLDDAAESI